MYQTDFGVYVFWVDRTDVISFLFTEFYIYHSKKIQQEDATLYYNYHGIFKNSESSYPTTSTEPIILLPHCSPLFVFSASCRNSQREFHVELPNRQQHFFSPTFQSSVANVNHFLTFKVSSLEPGSRAVETTIPVVLYREEESLPEYHIWEINSA